MMVTLARAWTAEAPGVGAPPAAGLSSPWGGPVLSPGANWIPVPAEPLAHFLGLTCPHSNADFPTLTLSI